MLFVLLYLVLATAILDGVSYIFEDRKSHKRLH